VAPSPRNTNHPFSLTACRPDSHPSRGGRACSARRSGRRRAATPLPRTWRRKAFFFQKDRSMFKTIAGFPMPSNCSGVSFGPPASLLTSFSPRGCDVESQIQNGRQQEKRKRGDARSFPLCLSLFLRERAKKENVHSRPPLTSKPLFPLDLGHLSLSRFPNQAFHLLVLLFI
jgi:hypothetical protein